MKEDSRRNNNKVGKEDKSSSSPTEALDEVKKRTKFSSNFAATRVNKLAKKIKIKISQKPREKEVLPAQKPGENASTTRASAKGGDERSSSSADSSAEREEIKIRKNALQIKKETEEMEKEYMEKEKIWEPPAFLRLRPKKLPFNPSRPKEENRGEI